MTLTIVPIPYVQPQLVKHFIAIVDSLEIGDSKIS